MISAYFGHPWMKKTMGNTLHYTENCTRSLPEEPDYTDRMIQRITIPTMRRQPEREDSHLWDVKIYLNGH